MSGGPVTLKDIATLAGVSTAAVSQALNDTGKLSAETRTRIRAVADSLGYVPNRAAAALRTGRTRTIGFVVDEDDEDEFGERRAVHRTRLFNALLRASAAEDYTVTVLPSSRPDLLRGAAMDALLHTGTDSLTEIIAEASRLGVRMAVCDVHVDAPRAISLRTGYDAAVRAGLDLLAAGGAERIGFLVDAGPEARNRIGENAYRSWSLERGRDRLVAEVDVRGQALIRRVHELLTAGVDALFAFSEDGPEIYLHLEEIGRVAPRDVQLFTLCTIDCDLNARLGISRACLHPDRAPQALFTALHEDHPPARESIIDLPWELLSGSTTLR
ncbi:LacI family DNA-binding transcriptional regulator [Microbacterium gorillae]|uniref:LacI family DNA-binding transcriptional regulator n=1 Tax=Microbacterium gorillae TaxID=1231063 RepID=UPI00058CB177|nr:LacI family DNA-binding transcriptional regulator [Microbacterium gorillae]